MQIPVTDTFGYAECYVNEKKTDLQVLWVCSWRFRLESNHVPKFLATVTGATSMLPRVRLSIFTLESCYFVPINLNIAPAGLNSSCTIIIIFFFFCHRQDKIKVAGK